MEINNKSILITGGTGTFGNYFIKHLLKKYKPKKVIIFSRDELKQFEMQKIFKNKCLRFFIGDVRDYNRLKLATKDIDILIHAAALKQVPTAEYNPMECIKTNIYGAENIITVSLENKIKKVIALSTDKACNPVNLYGASKLAAEKLFVAANNLTGKDDIQFSIVRYGNVFGSRGSIVPLFKSKIENREYELPVTDKNMTRFFITPEDAIKFVTKCIKMMKGGETFVPKSPSFKIIDLAKSLSNKTKIKIIGIRPGEKIYETLCPPEVSHLTLSFKDHFVIKPAITFVEKNKNYKKNGMGEIGKPVRSNFEYNSQNNSDFLSYKIIKKKFSI